MNLVRLGDNPFRKEHDAVHPAKEDFSVGLISRRPENTSDFRADVSWKDVENLIIEFAAMEEPRALQLQASKRLGDRALEAGWRPISNSDTT